MIIRYLDPWGNPGEKRLHFHVRMVPSGKSSNTKCKRMVLQTQDTNYSDPYFISGLQGWDIEGSCKSCVSRAPYRY